MGNLCLEAQRVSSLTAFEVSINKYKKRDDLPDGRFVFGDDVDYVGWLRTDPRGRLPRNGVRQRFQRARDRVGESAQAVTFGM